MIHGNFVGGLGYTVHFAVLLQLAVTQLTAVHAVHGVDGQHSLENADTGFLDFFGFGPHHHAVTGRGVAGGQQADFAFDFAGAHFAVTVFVTVHAVLRRKPFQIIGAEGGNEDSQLFGSLQNGAASLYLDDPSVDREFDHKIPPVFADFEKCIEIDNNFLI